MKLAIDFFTGSGSFATVARSMGYEVISIDNRRRAGTCEPTLKIDIRDLDPLAFSELNVKVMWFGLPCTIWSFASGGFHLDKDFQPKTELAVSHLQILESMQLLIEKSPDVYWFIENPRGNLQKYPPFKKWLDLNHGEINYCTLSSYGFPTTKPTMIATNYPGAIGLELNSNLTLFTHITLFEIVEKINRQLWGKCIGKHGITVLSNGFTYLHEINDQCKEFGESIHHFFFYCDPPYLFETRKSKTPIYDLEWETADHIHFLNAVIEAHEHGALIMISHYDCDLYRDYLKNWNTAEIQVMTRGGVATEKIWMNYHIEDHDLAITKYVGNNSNDRQRIRKTQHSVLKRIQNLPRHERQAMINYLKSNIDEI